MGNEDMSGCSHQTDHNDNERPLKKAKYVWQVKGKYHLKSGHQNKQEAEDGKNANEHTCECDKANGNEDMYKEKCIDKLLARTESILDSEEEDATQNIDTSISNEIPITLVSPTPKNQEYYLRKWQARQIARGYIDNTINSVLETWASAPFDAEDFVENCDNDGHVEDEGILMAIQAHGLQSKSSKKETSLSFVVPDELAENALEEIDPAGNEEEQPDVELDLVYPVYPVDILNAAILVAIEKKGLS